MNLADMLGYADIMDLSNIAKNYHCECNLNSKKELIQAILTAVNQSQPFNGSIQDWKDEDVRLINMLVFYPCQALSLEDLMAKVNQTNFDHKDKKNWNSREIIRDFKQRGWIFNGHSPQTKYSFLLPMDLKKKFARALISKFKGQVVYLNDEPAVYRDEQNLLAHDINLFLQCVLQNEIQLTVEGFMYK